jgi:hypothetical protein
MSKRADELAARFERAVADLAATVERCSEAQWRALCGAEQWTVAATAHHVGAQWPLEREYIVAAAEGATPPTHTWDEINQRNARHAQEFSAAARADVLSLLREGSASMAAYVRGLSDEQLDRTAPLALADGAEVSTQQLIEGGVLIAHATEHLQSIRAAG